MAPPAGGEVMDVSLDIEACGEVLMSLGAVEFNPITGIYGRSFYAVLALDPQVEKGLKLDPGAFIWWLTQDLPAREAITKAERELPANALQRFREWLGHPAPRVWAYPTSYDLPVIERVCRAFNVKVPWQWTNTMDARTLWKLALEVKPTLERVEAEATIEHHALEDAKQQAQWIVAYLAAIREAIMGDKERNEPACPWDMELTHPCAKHGGTIGDCPSSSGRARPDSRWIT